MGELVWTCGNGDFASVTGGLRLVVGRTPAGSGFRYQIFPARGDIASAAPVASGEEASLRAAIDSAELHARALEPSKSLPADA